MARRTRIDERPIPTRPYRDTALVYGVMAVLLVALAWLTGGDPVRAMLVAVVFFVVATAWSWWRFRRRILRRDAVKASASLEASDGSPLNDRGTGSET
jgi:membrane protein implicated in regulation of membrane protease activity